MEGWCYDIEGNNLYPYVDKIWTIHFKSLDKKRHMKVNPFKDKQAKQKIKEWIHSFQDGSVVVAHNGLGYDLWTIWKILGVVPRVGKRGKDYLCDKHVTFIDTFFLSMYLTPDLPSHSLEAHGERLGVKKLPYRQLLVEKGLLDEGADKGAEFRFYTEFMEDYCETDVDVNIELFFDLWDKAKKRYDDKWIHPSFKASQKSFYLMNAQEFTGVGFDKNYALEVKERLIQDIEKIRSEVEPRLPTRPMKKGELKEYTFPKKPFKNDGTFSSNLLKFVEKHNGKIIDEEKGIVEIYGKREVVESQKTLNVQLKMEMKDQSEMKDWFISLGWEPVFYNFKRDEKGKPARCPRTRQLITTTPKLQEQGNICPNLLEMEIPIVKDVVKYLSLRNRLGVIQGWINHPRLEWDGRLPAGSTKITPTFRQCHSVVCNVPKAEDGVLYGKEFRSLFVADRNNLLASADAAAGENRTEASYTLAYDGGEYAENLLKGDPHLVNMKAFYPEMEWVNIHQEGIKDDPKVKPKRSKSKNGKYALTFGCSPDKLSKTLGIPQNKAQQSYDAFWEANPALKLLRDNVEKYWEQEGQKKFLDGIDGRILSTRAKHALLNMLFQSALAIAMDYACCLMDMWLGELHLDEKGRPYYVYKGKIVKRVLYYHDELTFEQPPELSQEICELIAKSIIKAGEMVGLKIPLDADGITGRNWAEIH